MQAPLHPRGRTAVAVLFSLTLSACLTAPPRVSVDSTDTVVRADTVEEAEEIAELIEKLRPEVLRTLPDSRLEPMEVWMQEKPALYRFPVPASSDAEGLWAESHRRILIGRDADSIERTLAHELVHAALGESWGTLPGSLEEGLCDYVSAELSPRGAARLRAGRLSSAALATGGLKLELSIDRVPRTIDAPRSTGWSARIVLSGSQAPTDTHLDVFRVEAGLSSSTLSSGTKRGFYGLSFLVVDRIARRRGLGALHQMCLDAADAGHDRIPRPWLLLAAELSTERDDWRRAAAEGLGALELRELLRMYPRFVVDALVDYLHDAEGGPAPLILFDDLRATLRLVDGGAEVVVTDLDFVHAAVLERIRGDLVAAQPRADS